MKWVLFENPGVAELAALTTFGVNVKQNEGAIGFFGTGFKYAVAVVLRLGGRVVLYPGDGSRHEFTVVPETIRGRLFDLVRIDDRLLGFTTELGKQWEPWMAYRELACNAWDEEGEAELWEGGTIGAEGRTRLFVLEEGVHDAHLRRDQYFVRGRPAVGTFAGVTMLRGESDHAFYRGVAAARFTDGKSVLTYDVQLKMELTEDRSLKYPQHVQELAAMCVLQCLDEDAVEAALTAPKGTLEHGFRFQRHHGQPSEAFVRVARRLRSSPDRMAEMNPSAHDVLVRTGGRAMLDAPQATVTGAQAEMLLRAKQRLWSVLGADVDKFEVQVVDTLGTDVLGRALDGRIYISLRCFDMGEQMLMGTLWEEWVHLRMRYTDLSQGLQNYLVDQLMRQVTARCEQQPVVLELEDEARELPERMVDAHRLRSGIDTRVSVRGEQAEALARELRALEEDRQNGREAMARKRGQGLVLAEACVARAVPGEDRDDVPF